MSEPEEMVFVQLKHSISGRQFPRVLRIWDFFSADIGNKELFQKDAGIYVCTKCTMNMNQVKKPGSGKCSLCCHVFLMCALLC